MEKYYVVGLKNDEVARGALSKIADIIRNAFLRTGEAVMSGQLVGAQEHWADIKFESQFLLDSEVPNPYPEYDEILYLNQVAWDEFKKNGISLPLIEELPELPKRKLGNFISMPIYG